MSKQAGALFINVLQGLCKSKSGSFQANANERIYKIRKTQVEESKDF